MVIGVPPPPTVCVITVQVRPEVDLGEVAAGSAGGGDGDRGAPSPHSVCDNCTGTSEADLGVVAGGDADGGDSDGSAPSPSPYSVCDNCAGIVGSRSWCSRRWECWWWGW